MTRFVLLQPTKHIQVVCAENQRRSNGGLLSVGWFCLQKPHIGPALVQLEPAALDCVLDPGPELGPAGVERVQERRVDLLDMDAAVLDRLNAAGDLDQLARCGFGVGEGTFGG